MYTSVDFFYISGVSDPDLDPVGSRIIFRIRICNLNFESGKDLKNSFAQKRNFSLYNKVYLCRKWCKFSGDTVNISSNKKFVKKYSSPNFKHF